MAEETKEKQAAVNSSLTPKGTDAPEKNAPRNHSESPGEKIFHWGVYGGINYFLNLGISVAAADYFRNLSGREYLDKAIKATSKLLSSGNVIEAAKAQRFSKICLETLTLLSGGWLLLIPMKIMEDRKRPIVYWINKKWGVQQIGADGDELSHEEIYIDKEQPKQTWWNVFKRRIYATIAVSGVAGPLIEHTVGEERARHFVTKQVNKTLTSGFVPHGKWLAENRRSQAYIELAALDSFYTLVSAIVMRVTNGAKKAGTKQKVESNPITPNNNGISPSTNVYADDPIPREKPPDKRKAIITEGTKDFRTRAEIKSNQPSVVAP